MRMNELGRTGIKVSELCLGSMTWGNRNTTAEGHAQIDRALDAGINFIDTAEMYPVLPIKPETVGGSEEVIGTWIARNKARRGDVVIATKVSGPNPGFVREGKGYDADNITETIDASLRRLQTDVIDLYQLHWPSRGSYMFRQNWHYDPSGQDRSRNVAHMEGILRALQDAVQAGKVRAFGLSNESAWGTTTWVRLADELNLPRVAAIQNEYSLLCRLYDTDMAEVTANEDTGLLAWSPLGGSLLTGKHKEGTAPAAGTRLAIEPRMGGRINPRCWQAIRAYEAVAEKHGMHIVHLALAFCLSRPFTTSAIFGATEMEHVERALGASGLTLSDEVLADIDAAHQANPMPY